MSNGFKNIKEYIDADYAGQNYYFTWRKSPSQVTTAGIWFDLSMSPGNPVPQYYASSPLISVAMRKSTDGGIEHGGAVSPKIKVLDRFTALSNSATGLPIPLILCEGTTDEQSLTNSTTLPRYTDGSGVQIMAVSVAGRTGGQSFVVKYCNQSGVTDRVTRFVVENTATATGSIVTSATATNNASGPFIPLQEGDTGVRYIQSVTMLGTDVGLFSLVLVKPIITTMIVEQTAPVETVPLQRQGLQLPIIQDDAYLNLLCLPSGSLAPTALHGDIKVTWN